MVGNGARAARLSHTAPQAASTRPHLARGENVHRQRHIDVSRDPPHSCAPATHGAVPMPSPGAQDAWLDATPHHGSVFHVKRGVHSRAADRPSSPARAQLRLRQSTIHGAMSREIRTPLHITSAARPLISGRRHHASAARLTPRRLGHTCTRAQAEMEVLRPSSDPLSTLHLGPPHVPHPPHPPLRRRCVSRETGRMATGDSVSERRGHAAIPTRRRAPSPKERRPSRERARRARRVRSAGGLGPRGPSRPRCG